MVKLSLIELSIETSSTEKLIVGSSLDDMAVAHHEDTVGSTYC
jgi:hypothetical protein